MQDGGGGMAAVSFGIDERWLYLAAIVIVLLIAWGGVKLVKLLWAAFSG
jgi:hypothetical protein